jgi:hypothetical protein
MPFVIASPDAVSAAAMDLTGIGSTLNAINAAVAAPTTGLLAPAADKISLALAELFGAHGRAYQSLSSDIAAFHSQFVQALNTGAGAYASAEAANASPLQAVEQAAPSMATEPAASLIGQQPIGSGTYGTAGRGETGGPGRLLWGGAGNGGSDTLRFPVGTGGTAGLCGYDCSEGTGGLDRVVGGGGKGGILFGTGGRAGNGGTNGGNAALLRFGGIGGNAGETGGRGGSGGILSGLPWVNLT